MAMHRETIDFGQYDSPAPTTSYGTKRGRDGKEKESFRCSHPGCGQTYSRMEYLKRHQRKHQDVRPFACRDCDKSFARSDVLLRHRRRCHPTPPPESRSSRSPGPAPRVHPGMPISSSRNDSREFSPTRDRYHDRDDFAATQLNGHEHNRTRTISDEGDEDGYMIAQHSLGLGEQGVPDDSGVYDIGGNYYDLGESSAYTPHLLPMFQHPAQARQAVPFQHTEAQPQQQNPDDSGHLEDASVLLSMAYPGGVPGDGKRAGAGRGSVSDSANPIAATTSEPARPALLPDWNGQTINMMLEQNQDVSTAAGDVALGESVGNFLNSMGWLGDSPAAKAVDRPEQSTWAAGGATLSDAIDPMLTGSLPSTFATQSASTTVTQPTTSSPFPLSSLFSPSLFGIPSLPPLTNSTESSPTDADDDFGAAHSTEVKSILEQLAVYDRPQTRATVNTNPERPLIRIANQAVYNKQGRSLLSPDSPFYVNPARFTSCYEIPHWRMPPVRVLSLMAAKTYHTVLNHFSFIHQPTFRLHDTAACLAFAICTVGGIRSARRQDPWNHLLPHIDQALLGGSTQGKKMDGPVVPEASWESLYESNYAGRRPKVKTSPISTGLMLDSMDKFTPIEEELDDERRMVEEWETAGLVRNDKTNMLVKSFSQAKGVLMTEYNVALLQSLVLYHAPYFLSESEQERAMANMFLGTIVNITRQIGFLTQELEHFEPQIRLPREPSTPNDLNLAWRRWIQLETRRRTAFLVYHLDTVSSLEASTTCIFTSCELSNLPLPAPDTLWKAPTAEAWAQLAKSYRPITLDEAMRRIFFLTCYGAFDTLHEKATAGASGKYYNLLNTQVFGPFARVAMILTLVRGIIDVGEGKRDRGDWRDLTDLWIGCPWLKPGKKLLDGEGREIGEVTREGLRSRFALGLERWRQGWDFDPLCLSRVGSPGSGTGAQEDPAPKILMYCEEALPFYWLAQALLSILNSSPSHLPSFNAFQGIKYGEMLKSARTFTRLGEGMGAASAMGSCTSNGNGATGGGENGNLSFDGAGLGFAPVVNQDTTSGGAIANGTGATGIGPYLPDFAGLEGIDFGLLGDIDGIGLDIPG